MSDSSYRVTAILTAKAGRGQELVEFTRTAIRRIRDTDGLLQVEVSQSLTDSEQLVLYYHWESPAHSQRYVAGPVYSNIAPQLESLVREHRVIMSQLLGD